MPKRLTNEEDVRSTQKSFQETSKVLKFEENSKSPLYLLSDAYEEGYVHWIQTPDGKTVRVVCGGGLDGKGFAPSECKVCNYLIEGYKEAKALEATDADAAKKMRERLNRMRANYSAEFLAVKGETILVKDAKTGKKTAVPDFDEAEVGILALSEPQFQELIGLVGAEEYPFMKGFDDLLNRVINLDKRKRDGKGGKKAKFPTVKFIPSSRQSDVPTVEFNKEEFDTAKDFEIDEEKIDQAFELLNGQADYTAEEDDADLTYEDDDGDDGVDSETSEDEDQVAEDDQSEDDDPADTDDEDSGVEIEGENDQDAENDLSDISEEISDDFEDDLPEEHAEVAGRKPQPKPQPQKKNTALPTKKPAPAPATKKPAGKPAPAKTKTPIKTPPHKGNKK